MLLQDYCHAREDVITISSGDRISQAAMLMQAENVGSVVVVDGQKVVGIITDRDISLSVVLGAATPDSFVNEVMSRDIQTVPQDSSLFDVTRVFRKSQVRRLPVVDANQQLVGIISLDDTLGLLARELYNVCNALEPAIGHRV